VTRLAGKDRFATSAAVAATFEPGVAAVYVATGAAFPDALAAAAAAGANGAPMLLTTPWALPPIVSKQIGALDPARAVIAGGWAAVSDAALAGVRSAVAS
jgi:putative cell wall-binding protein